MFDNRIAPGDRDRLTAVESELLTLAGDLAAATCRYLQLLAEFDTAGGWAGPGLRSCAHWLNWKVGENLRTAREHLRVAHTLAALPLITAAFATGRISYAKVRALTRIAEPATESGLLSIALRGTASHVESVVTAVRARRDPRPATAARSMQWTHAQDGSLRVSLRLPPEQGAQLLAAIDATLAAADATLADTAADTADTDTATADDPAHDAADDPADNAADNAAAAPARRLDALMALVTGQRPIPDTTLVVHLRAETPHDLPDDRLDDHPVDLPDDRPHDLPDDHPVGLPRGPGDPDGPAGTAVDGSAVDGSAEPSTGSRPPEVRVAWIEGGPPLHPAVAERLTCGATIQALITDRHDHPLYLARRRRTVTPALLRAVRVRDRDRCVFPGCPATRHLHAHHLRWWRHGGATDLDNLALLCTFHHHLVHDGGYRLHPDGLGGFTATQPDTTQPDATQPDATRPDATAIPAAGPPTRGRPDALRRPGIDEHTTTPDGGGERLDHDLVLAWLLPTRRAAPPAAA